jgi:hypothetical protein
MGFLQVGDGQMQIPLRGRQRAMSQDFLHMAPLAPTPPGVSSP